MTPEQLANKFEQFNEFFAIKHEFNINITPIQRDTYPTFEQFEAAIPLPFQMASDLVTIDQAALRSLRGLGDKTDFLVQFLNHQSQKIELLVNYILSLQDNESSRYKGTLFGGGGLIFESPTTFDVGELLELKIFMLDENCAIFCIAEVIEQIAIHDTIQHKVVFHLIRDQDREVLVRTSLHLQAQQLQALAKKRRQSHQESV
jgi:hypothetical protein